MRARMMVSRCCCVAEPPGQVARILLDTTDWHLYSPVGLDIEWTPDYFGDLYVADGPSYGPTTRQLASTAFLDAFHDFWFVVGGLFKCLPRGTQFPNAPWSDAYLKFDFVGGWFGTYDMEIWAVKPALTDGTLRQEDDPVLPSGQQLFTWDFPYDFLGPPIPWTFPQADAGYVLHPNVRTPNLMPLINLIRADPGYTRRHIDFFIRPLAFPVDVEFPEFRDAAIQLGNPNIDLVLVN